MDFCSWEGCGYSASARCVGCGSVLCGRHFLRDEWAHAALINDVHAHFPHALSAEQLHKIGVSPRPTGSLESNESIALKDEVLRWVSDSPGSPECVACLGHRADALRDRLDTIRPGLVARQADTQRKVREMEADARKIGRHTPGAVRIRVPGRGRLWAVPGGETSWQTLGRWDVPTRHQGRVFRAEDGKQYKGTAGFWGTCEPM